jgi:cell division protein FtsI/penicillin-binding protein 2
VLDRQGRELARSLDTESFYGDPSEIKNVEATAGRVSAITGQDRVDLTRRLNDAQAANKKFIWIVRRVEMERANKLDGLELEGVYSRREPKRYYPNDTLARTYSVFTGTDEIGLSGVSSHNKIRARPARSFWQWTVSAGLSRATKSNRIPARPSS